MQELSIEDREVLAGPFNGIESFTLTSPPNVEFLKWLPELPVTIGLRYADQVWRAIKGSDIGIPVWVMSPTPEIFVRSSFHSTEDPEGTLPSLRDLFNIAFGCRNFIVGEGGITRYFPPQAEDAGGRLYSVIINGKFSQVEEASEYLAFLNEIEAKHQTTPWVEVTEDKLNELFYLPSLDS